MTAPRDALLPHLDAARGRLRGFVEKEGRGLLRHESVEDLVQGIQMHALGVAERFAYRGEKEFLAWLFTVARQHFANRQRYWTAARRDGGHLLRVTTSGAATGAEPQGVDPAAGRTGPGTLASRREQLALAAKVVTALDERDQKLVTWMSQDVPLEEVASRLGIGYEAAKRARLRAIERFRAAYERLASGERPVEEPES